MFINRVLHSSRLFDEVLSCLFGQIGIGGSSSLTYHLTLKIVDGAKQ